MVRLFGLYVDFPGVVLAVFEMAVFFLVVLGLDRGLTLSGYGTGVGGGESTALLVTLAFGAGMMSVGLYNRQMYIHRNAIATRVLVVAALLLVAMLGSVGLHDLFAVQASPRGYYLFCLLTTVAFVPVQLTIHKGFVRIFVDGTGTFTRRVAVIGTGERAAKIERLGRSLEDRAYVVVGCVRFGAPPEVAEPADPGGTSHKDVWLNPDDLPRYCKENRIEELVAASNERRGMPVHALLACKLAGVRITEYATFWERESGQVDLDEISPSWLVFSDGFRMSALRGFAKRIFDALAALLLLLVTLPITIPTALLIRLESPGPIFYRQVRVGLRNQPFTILKFRSMRVDAEKDGPRWAVRNDNRVTRVGAIIRKVRIDEIPQVLNVLRGDMSFVGPRPERPVFVDALSQQITYYDSRHVVKPGITGWAQINYRYGASGEDAKIKLTYDLYYIKNGSLLFDIVIMLQTVRALVWNDGAH